MRRDDPRRRRCGIAEFSGYAFSPALSSVNP
jgi:hypothetical protein